MSMLQFSTLGFFSNLPMILHVICYPGIKSLCLNYLHGILFCGPYSQSPRSVIHKYNKPPPNMTGLGWRERRISVQNVKDVWFADGSYKEGL